MGITLSKILFFCSALPLLAMEGDKNCIVPDLHIEITEWDDETADFESYEVNDEEFELIIQHLFKHYNNDLQRHKYLFESCLEKVKSIETKEK